MTKEQETIERLNSLIKINKDFFESQGNMIINKRDILAIETVLNMLKEKDKEIEKKDRVINEIQNELRSHIGFENRLKREKKEPDLFNQGRFYVANNINNILKGKVRND